jgi:hypothetical protein
MIPQVARVLVNRVRLEGTRQFGARLRWRSISGSGSSSQFPAL